MPRPKEFWIELRNAFNLDEVLVGERSEAFYCEREHSPFDDMCLDLDQALQLTRPPIAFFTGHRGSGKSSLLMRFLDRLKGDYFITYFDIHHNLDSRKANQIDLLYLMGATVFRVAEQEGIRPDPENLRELAESIYMVTETKKETRKEGLDLVGLAKGLLCFGASMFGSKLGEKLAEAVLKPFTITSGVSEEVARKREIEPQVQNIVNNVNLIIADVQTRADKPVLIVVDGLDKLQRPEQAQLIFLESRALRGPCCAVIYTVPMLLYNSLQFGQIEEECKSYLLPNVKLYDKRSDSEAYGKGYDTLRVVVARRLRSMNLQADDVFEPDVLDSLILKSGGVMRWFIGLVQEACKAAQHNDLEKVSRTAAEKAIDDRVADLAGRLTTSTVKELREVRQEKRPSGSRESSELLHGLLIVAYRNRSTWYDAHPLIWDEL